jgi:hypothetical protein
VFLVRYEMGFYIPEDDILHSDRRETLKSYTFEKEVERRISGAYTSVGVTKYGHRLYDQFPMLTRCYAISLPRKVETNSGSHPFPWPVDIEHKAVGSWSCLFTSNS